ncbi:uncharacterized protein LOC111830221 [Capsella rubella]|uniref:uncharacterized protein LOC111830221 n=1 Tax=Capsella rubella TaxID=81985 RepID=UPI000CD4FA74|nr:uncharacterized protein LOC111830221 [Capsella rubella]XP_023637623.1 uncharacterized protein LOC111830221 [Capsella rubella]
MLHATCQDLTNKDTSLSCALRWFIEWLQAYFLVFDDIMDNSVTPRGKRVVQTLALIQENQHIKWQRLADGKLRQPIGSYLRIVNKEGVYTEAVNNLRKRCWQRFPSYKIWAALALSALHHQRSTPPLPHFQPCDPNNAKSSSY